MIVSRKGALISEDVRKILVGAGVASVGAGATFLLDALTKVDFGAWTPAVVMALSILANVVRKWLSETKYR